jgi:predicted nucleic acid-binding Zn ribbon protein
MASCVICSKPIIGKRRGAKTCSNACRSKAYYKRKSADRKWKAANLDMFDNQDLRRIGRISFSAAEMIVKVSTIGGREMARELIDSITDLLSNAGVNWQNG